MLQLSPQQNSLIQRIFGFRFRLWAMGKTVSGGCKNSNPCYVVQNIWLKLLFAIIWKMENKLASDEDAVEQRALLCLSVLFFKLINFLMCQW